MGPSTHPASHLCARGRQERDLSAGPWALTLSFRSLWPQTGNRGAQGVQTVVLAPLMPCTIAHSAPHVP